MTKHNTDALGAGSYPEPPDVPEAIPRCPVCGAECETVYKRDGDFVGCDVCVKESYADWEPACFPSP